jgi:hypothetical protein
MEAMIQALTQELTKSELQADTLALGEEANKRVLSGMTACVAFPAKTSLDGSFRADGPYSLLAGGWLEVRVPATRDEDGQTVDVPTDVEFSMRDLVATPVAKPSGSVSQAHAAQISDAVESSDRGGTATLRVESISGDTL